MKSYVLRPRAPKSKAFIADIAIHLDVIYLVGGTYHEPTILASSDAMTFHKKKTPDTPGLRGIIALPDDLFVCGEYGALYYSTNLGDDWTKIDTSTQACLFAMERDSSGDLWVTGDDGFVLRSTDQGTTWSTFDAGTKQRIGNVVADGDALYFLCADGSLIQRKNGALTTLFQGTAPLTDLVRTPYGLFVSGDRGQLLRTTDGSKLEKLEAVGADVDLEALAYGEEGGLFVVGSRGTVLRSVDGKRFESIDSTTRDHLYSARATGRGVLIGGEGGAVLHVRADDDTTWAAKTDLLGDKPGELDALFLEGDLDEFVTNGLVQLVGGVDDGPYPGAEELEAVWGTKLPDEIGAMLKAIAKGAGKVLYEWRPELYVPSAPPEENLFEQLVIRDQENYLGTSFVEALTGQIYLGTYGNGDSHLASLYGDDALGQGKDPAPGGARIMHIFDHEEHNLSFETGKSVSRFAYFSALCKAIHEQRISEQAAKQAFERVRDSITPSWHYRSTIEEAGVDEFEGFKEERPYGRIWYARGLWLVYLLRKDRVVDLEDIKGMFFPGHNPPLQGDVHERWTKSSQRLVPTALYCMLRCFFFDDPKLEGYLAIGRAHPSRIARDCAKLIDDTLAGRRKALGKIPDLLELRSAFQKLDLDPARQEARQAEAEERARAIAKARADAKERAMALPDPVATAWSALDDLPMQEAIEARLRGEPALEATFAAIDFVLGQKYVRENLVLDHERDEELEWLGMHGDPAVLPLLVGALVRPTVASDEEREDEAPPIAIFLGHPNAAGKILIAFGERGRLDARAVPALRRILDAKEKYEWRRARAVALLGLLRDVESLPALEELAAWLPTDDYVEAIARKDLAIAIPRALMSLGDARAIPILTKMISSSDKTAKDGRTWVAEALGALGAVSTWREVLRHAADTDRKPAAWLLWAVGMLGAKADAATKREIVDEVRKFEPKWGVFYLDLVRDGVLARLGAPPENFAATLDRAFTQPGWDAETTSLQEAWTMRIIGVTEASTQPLMPFLRRDDSMLRRVAREALERRGENVPAVRYLHRAEVARLEREGVNALIAAFNDETAIYRHVVASRLGELKAEAARAPLVRFVREIVARTPRDTGAKLTRDDEYPLRWALKALLDIGANAEVVAVLGEVLVHPSRDVKDPVLRYAEALPDDPGLIEPMLRVADEKWGWQEGTANAWLEAAKAKHGRAYEEALSRLRRPS